jgi:hypothetical protein
MFEPKALAAILFSTVAIAGAVVWLAREAMRLVFSRSLASHESQLAASLEIQKTQLAASLESYKAQLAADAARQLASLTSDLERATFQHTTTFSIMHQRRAEVIAELYALFVEAEDRADLYLSNTDHKREGELAEYAYEGIRPLRKYFDKHRIFFTSTLCVSAEALLSTIHRSVWIASVMPNTVAPESPAALFAASKHIEQFTAFRTGVGKLRPALETEFRKVIGSDGGSLDVGVVVAVRKEWSATRTPK